MDADAVPTRSFAARLRTAFAAISGACSYAAKVALNIALPTLCAPGREPVEGKGVWADCWLKLSFIELPYCPRLGIPFDPGPDMLSVEAPPIPRPSAPALQCVMTKPRACRCMR